MAASGFLMQLCSPTVTTWARRCHVGVFAVVVLAGACGDPQREPAQAAIQQVETALASAGTAPAQYVPGKLAKVQDQVAALKADFEHGDYRAVLAAAPAALAAARTLPGLAAARKTDFDRALQQEWSALAAMVPTEIERVARQLDDVAAARNPGSSPPPSAATLERAHRMLGDARALWTQASAEATAGRLPEAVTLGTQARQRAVGISAAVTATAEQGALK